MAGHVPYRRIRCVALVIGVLVLGLGAAPGEPTGPTEPVEPAEPVGRAPAVEEQVLFERDTLGYDCFRIPAIVATTRGTLLAFAEARTDVGDGWCEDAGAIDLVVRRSSDGGTTWGEPITVASGVEENATRGNPVPIVARGGEHDGRIVLLTTHNPAGQNTPRTPYVQYSTAEQDGTTWTEPKSVAGSLDDPDWDWLATGPGHGIQLTGGEHAGRLVAGVNAGTPDGDVAFLAYSDDAGTTWRRGPAQPGGRRTEPADDAEGAGRRTPRR